MGARAGVGADGIVQGRGQGAPRPRGLRRAGALLRSPRACGALAALLLALGFLVLPRHELTNPDGIGYFSYLPSLADDGDILFWDEFFGFRLFENFLYATETDHAGNHWQIGPALFWAPWYGLGRAVEAAARWCGRPWGLPLRERLGIAYALFGTWLAAAAAALALVEVLRCLKLPWPRLSVLLVLAGSPFPFYLLRAPSMPHVVSLCAVSLFLLAWLRLRERGRAVSPAQALGLGLLGGLAVLVRSQSIVLLVLPLLDRLLERPRRALTGRSLAAAGAYAGGALLAASPQALAWWVIYGRPWGTPQTGFMEWTRPALLQVLLSPFHGLLFWSPVLLLGLLGLVGLAWRQPRLGGLLLGFFLSQLYLNAAFAAWWGSGSFGGRRFMNVVPVLAIGLGILLRGGARRRRLVGALAVVGVVWTLLLLLAYPDVRDLVALRPTGVILADVAGILPVLPARALGLAAGFDAGGLSGAAWLLPLVAALPLLVWLWRWLARRLRPAALLRLGLVLALGGLLSLDLALVRARGVARMRAAEYSGVVERYRRSPEEAQRRVALAVYVGRSEMAAARGDWAVAVRELEQAAELFPDDRRLAARLAHARRMAAGR